MKNIDLASYPSLHAYCDRSGFRAQKDMAHWFTRPLRINKHGWKEKKKSLVFQQTVAIAEKQGDS